METAVSRARQNSSRPSWVDLSQMGGQRIHMVTLVLSTRGSKGRIAIEDRHLAHGPTR